MRDRSVLVAYALFVLVGLSAGVNGVLLFAQMDDYSVGRATIGITFFTFSAGFILAGATTGPLLHRWGTRATVLGAGAILLAALLVTGSRPTFAIFVAAQVVVGYGSGLVESVANAHLAAQPNATTLLNRLHAFFGVGALLGPVLAEAMLRVTVWPAVVLTQAAVSVPILVAVWFTFPGRRDDAPSTRTHESQRSKGLLPAVLRSPAVLLGATMLSLYVGLEIGVGNWGFSYLVEGRDVPPSVASWTISAYWLGLTVGRFVISPVTTRLGLTKMGLGYVCMVGVVVATLVSIVAPLGGLVTLGFFLGPIFPTAISVAPELIEERLVPTAIGVMNGGSVIGGSALPWLAGAIGQGVGVWTLLPFTLVLGLLQWLVWWGMAARVRVPLTSSTG